MCNKQIKHKKEKKLSSIEVGAINSEIVQRYGEAASQILQGYKGIRVDSKGIDQGFKGRSLEEISNYKLNETYKDQNISQQAGFSGELIKESRDNKNAILSGNKNRTITTDGIGETNNQLHDHKVIDVNGNVVEGSGSQMKILNDPQKVVENVRTGKYDKYLDSPLDVPSEQVEVIKNLAREERLELLKEAEKCKENGKYDLYEKKLEQAKKLEKLEENVRDSGVTRDEAIDARLNVKKFVAKEVLRDSHNAGIAAAKNTGLLAAGISIAQNSYAVIKGEKEVDEACISVVKDTSIAAGTAYGVTGVGTLIKSCMHSSKSELIRRVGTSNVPAMMVVATLEIGKSLKKYANNEISELELLQELGEKGTSTIGASYGAALGTAVFPGIGTIIGGMIGYTTTGIIYKASLEILEKEKISAERRRIIESICEEAIERLEEYRLMIIVENNSILDERNRIIQRLVTAINTNNSESFRESIDTLGRSFGVKLQFDSFEEFDEFMSDENTEIIL